MVSIKLVNMNTGGKDKPTVGLTITIVTFGKTAGTGKHVKTTGV